MKVTVGGKEIDPVAFRRNIAYVMQDDALMATATPREALRFSASLRLPATTSAAEIDELVEKVLVDLGLTDCADVLIGGAMIKGISGGQRKRTSVGVEIITDPSVGLFFSCLSAMQNEFILCTLSAVAVPGRAHFWSGLVLGLLAGQAAERGRRHELRCALYYPSALFRGLFPL
ncbi:ATP-binding cassette domain-containing protein [archaeon]|nr:MAG: ATP-binding cassette domain-containing protein [archaeon]